MLDNKYKTQYLENLNSKTWMGIIVDSNDPIRQGRCKVRVFELFDQRDFENEEGDYPDKMLTFQEYLDEENFIIKNEDLPWIFPNNSTIFAGGESKGYGSFSFPKTGTLVEIEFVNGDVYSGRYKELVKPNPNMLSIVESDEDYENSMVLVYDEDEDYHVAYTKTRGLQIYHKGSQFVLRPDSSIYIEHKDTQSAMEFKGQDIYVIANRDISITSKNKISVNSQTVHVNGETVYIGDKPAFSGVLGEPLITLLKSMATTMDIKYPPSPGATTAIVDSAKNAILSNSVKTSK